MNDLYLQGFIEKCAEHGVDPEALLKAAFRADYLRRGLAAVSPKALISLPMNTVSQGRPYTAKRINDALAMRYANPGRYASDLNALEYPSLRTGHPGQVQGIRDFWAHILKQVRTQLKTDGTPLASKALVSNEPAMRRGTWK